MAKPKTAPDLTTAAGILADQRLDLVHLVATVKAGMIIHGHGDLVATMDDALTDATNALGRLEVATRSHLGRRLPPTPRGEATPPTPPAASDG